MTASFAAATPELEQLIDRYVAQWHEPDAAERRQRIEELWAPDAANFTASFEVHGHDEVEGRVRTTYEKWVRDAGCVFRPRHAAAHHDAIHFAWDMAARDDGNVASVGVEILLLGPDGRIRADYQFIEPTPA